MPSNPTTINANYERYKRQLGFYDPSEHGRDQVSIIGLGGIGSFAAFGIAKLGVPNITLVDFDTVEEHNIPNQFHALDQITMPKADSMAATIQAYTGTIVNTIEDAIGGADAPDAWNPEGVIVSGVDSMAARIDIWNRGKIKFNPRVTHYIDARIAGQLLVVYCVNPNDLKETQSYEKTLHTDAEAEPAACTERGVIDVGLMAGAILTNMVRHALTGGQVCSVTPINMAHPQLTAGKWVL